MNPEIPENLGPSGAALWRRTVGDFELQGHELTMLEHACVTADVIDVLTSELESGKVVEESPHGRKINPAAPELRQQMVVFARIIAALGLPAGEVEEDEVPKQQRRSVRGVYAVQAP